MKTVDLSLSCPRSASYRVSRVESLFNVSRDHRNVRLQAELPTDQDDWSVGLIVGASGSGKSSLGRAAWGPTKLHKRFRWGKDAIVDEIAPGIPMDKVTAALSSVGLGSVPAWVRPFSVLSTGEKFRAEMARMLLSDKKRVVIDEFTSVVDRQVAQIEPSPSPKPGENSRGDK